MNQHTLFLTGKLAQKQLYSTLEKMQPEFSYQIHQLGLKVAALMTAEMITRRLNHTAVLQDVERIIVPGRCLGDLELTSKTLGIPVLRGPDELKDLPRYFGKEAQAIDLSHYSVKIFAEIVDAPKSSVADVLQRAFYYVENGADVIDIGCLPSTDFPLMEEMIQELKRQGFTVSIDSHDTQDLLRGGKAGADYLLSLHEKSLWLADEVASTPVIIPAIHEDLASLNRAIAIMQTKNRPFIVDPILDPVHFGFTRSIARYLEVRETYPEIEMMLGVGNITELVHADTSGMNALLLGICSELNINHILTTEVSRHACRAVKEADVARRIMFAAKELNTLPKHLNSELMTTHETAAYLYSMAEIQELAAEITDPSFRIQTSPEGVHIFNRDGLHTAVDPFALYSKLGVENDASHAFYLGAELTKAQIAWQLNKRYTQDQDLSWGCAVTSTEPRVNLHTFKPSKKS